jgi:MFS family permease
LLKCILTATGFGAACGVFLCNRFLDRIYIALGKSNGGTAHPEFRLPFMIAASIVFPFIVALYGWAPYANWSIYIMLLAVALLGFVMMIIMVPLSSYVVDAFGLYSASAMTMVLIVRCLCGTLLPLVVPPLTEAFGLGYAFMILAAVCFVFMPFPALVYRYGWKWRQNSSYTKNE